ncbi:MAG: phosphoribosyl-AMP cyclohydrolase [Bauldia sp.]
MAAGSAHDHELETTSAFTPRFGPDGLIPAVVTDAASGDVVMFAWMDREALDLTLTTGIAHYFSRSRQKLWKKGETSGNTQAVVDMRIDCDQDVVWLRVNTAGDGANCHTGAKSCFYRQVVSGPTGEAELLFLTDEAPGTK